MFVCVFSSHSFWTSSSLDVPGSHRRKGHTRFFIHIPSAVRALIFLARRIQPFLSLVDREVEFCVLRNEEKSRLPGSNSRPNVSEGYEVTSELPGRYIQIFLRVWINRVRLPILLVVS